MNHLPIPVDQTEGLPEEVPTVGTKPKSVTVKQAEKAAIALGMEIMDARSLKEAGVLGEFVKDVGAIAIGRARLAMNLRRMDKAMNFLESKFETEEDGELMVGMMKVHADLIGKSNSASELLIKSAQTAAETAKTEAGVVLPGFAPGARVGPTPARPAALVQVNVNSDPKKTEVSVEGESTDEQQA